MNINDECIMCVLWMCEGMPGPCFFVSSIFDYTNTILNLATLQIMCIMIKYTYFHRYKLSIVNPHPHSFGSIHHAFVVVVGTVTSISEKQQPIRLPFLHIYYICTYLADTMNCINCQFAFNSFVEGV